MQYISKLGSAYESKQEQMQTDMVERDSEGGSGSELEAEL